MERHSLNWTLDGCPIRNGFEVSSLTEEEIDLEIAKIYRDAEEFESTIPNFDKRGFIKRKMPALRKARKAAVDSKPFEEPKLHFSRTTLYSGIDGEVYDVLINKFPGQIEDVYLDEDGELWIYFQGDELINPLENFLNRLGLVTDMVGEYNVATNSLMMVGIPVF